MDEKIKNLILKAQHEVTSNILSYWINTMVDNENGGYYGKRDFYNKLDTTASKGAVLNTRILWTFSKAYNVFKDNEYLNYAWRAYNYIEKYFRDPVNDGVYWELDYQGNPINTQKYCYTQGFWIYALSEFYKSTKHAEAIATAYKMFHLLDEKALDKQRNGYVEAFAKDWTTTNNVRISEKDLNENKTYNTHLHILESYASLYKVKPSEELKKSLTNLIILLAEKFYNPNNGHFKLFFDDDWNEKGDLISYGHDIEGSWLLWDAIEAIGSDELKNKYLPIVIRIAEVSAAESIDKDGGQFYEGDSSGVKDTDKHWWPQAEVVVGFLNAYQLTNNKKFLDLACNSWEFIENYIIDKVNGEWHWKIDKNGVPYKNEVKAGFWKCPYHNSRCCFEIITRFGN